MLNNIEKIPVNRDLSTPVMADQIIQGVNSLTRLFETINDGDLQIEEAKTEQLRIKCNMETIKNDTIRFLGQCKKEIEEITARTSESKLQVYKEITEMSFAHEKEMRKINIEHEERMKIIEMIKAIVDNTLDNIKVYRDNAYELYGNGTIIDTNALSQMNSYINMMYSTIDMMSRYVITLALKEKGIKTE